MLLKKESGKNQNDSANEIDKIEGIDNIRSYIISNYEHPSISKDKAYYTASRDKGRLKYVADELVFDDNVIVKSWAESYINRWKELQEKDISKVILH